MKVRRFAVLGILVLGLFTTALHADTVNGQIANLYSSHFTVETGQAFGVSSSTVVTYDGARYAYTSLKPGMPVAVEYAACGMKLPCASKISATSGTTTQKTTTTTTTSQTEGEISGLASSTFKLSSGEGFNVNSMTVVTVNGMKSAYSSLTVGMPVVVDWARCKSANYLPCASKVTASSAPKTSNTVDGSIKELYASQFLLSTGQTFAVNSSTKVYYNGSATTYGNLKTGMLASVSPVDCGYKYPCAAQIMAKDSGTAIQK